ncbi:MAG TPA: class I SAM-dependent methyltransferase [Bryobacteraceae bacterium]|jgi:ubiquinone/menaquinone biosynthesis C-methylase UbiE|nr:class I SAM-dependent methyltransferase [Bryobacteraceae bacterium]
MSSAPQTQPPSPALFFDTMNAYQRTAAVKGAIQLDVFTAIGEGNTSAAALSGRCDTSERGMRILCDYLVIIGFLTKDGTDYRLTPDSAMFLDRRSPAYMGTAERFLSSATLMDAFRDVPAIVRNGGSVMSAHGTMEPDHPIWVEFARAMAPMMSMPAEFIANLVGSSQGAKWKVLDIAAGHGYFGIAIARHNPNATIVAADWHKVLEVAKEHALKAGVADRYATLPGSAFETQFGTGYHLVLLTNFLHHFDIPTCEALLRKIHAALEPGGRVVTLDFVPNEDRVSPPTTAAFSFIMLGTTEGGDAYTFSEYKNMFHKTGFERTELHPIPGMPSQVLVSYK